MFRKPSLLVLLLLAVLAACSQVTTPETVAPPEVPALPPGVRMPWDDTLPDPDELSVMFGGAKRDFAFGLAKHGLGTYVVGETTSNLHGTHQGGGDAFIRMYDADGGLIWGQQFGTAKFDSAKGVAADAFNNAYVVGTTSGSFAGKNAGSYDIFVRKYRPDGRVAWTRQFGTTGDDSANGVAADPHGNVYVVGYQNGRHFLRKYRSDGTRVWTYHASTGQRWLDVAVDAHGTNDIYVAGFTTTKAGMMLRKFSPGGGAYWTREVTHYAGRPLAGAYGTTVAVWANQAYLVGNYQEYYYGATAFATKFNSDGVQQWSRPYGTDSPYYVYDASTDGTGLYFTGHYYQSSLKSYTGLTTKASASNGQDLWHRRIESCTLPAYNSAVVARSIQDVYVAGYSACNVGAGNQGGADAYLRRLNPADGATVWTR